MPVIVACPSCGGKLRVADTLRGQRVRCPACNHAFDSAAEPTPPPPASQDVPLQLALDDPASPPSAPSRTPDGLFGAVEIKRPGEVEPAASPPSEAEPSQPPRQSRRAERQSDWDVPDIRRRLPRRDAEPDRGVLVLVLGIISLAGTVIYCAAPLWAILGLVAWIMGQTDLRKMKSGLMDDNGRSITQAGWICGILGVVLNGLWILLCGGFIGVTWYLDMSRPPNTTPLPPPPAKKAPLPPKAPPALKR